MIKVSRRQFELVTAAYYLLILAVTILLMIAQGIAQNKLIETLFIMAAFLALKQRFKQKLESGSMLFCLMASVLVFTMLTRLSLPIGISLMCSPVLGMLTAYVATRIVIQRTNAAELRDKVDEIMKTKPFDCKTATLETFMAQCLSVGYDMQKTEFAIDALSLLRIPIKDLMQKYCLSERTTKRKKANIKKDLEVGTNKPL